MVKKELTNKKVVRAIALGLSAVMLTTPITAHAETVGNIDSSSGNDDGEGKKTTTVTIVNVSSVCDGAQSAADAVDAAVDKADTSKEVVKADIDQNVVAGEIKDSDGNPVIVEVGDEKKDVAQAVIDELKDDTDLSSENKENYPTDVDKAMKAVDTDLRVAEVNSIVADGGVKSAEKAVENATVAVGEANAAMDNAQTVVNEKTDDIKGATTVEEANTAYEELMQGVSNAQATFDEKLKEYNKAKEAYEAAEKIVKDAETAYNNAVSDATDDAKKAAEVLAVAKKEADELASAVAVAKDAVDNASKAAMDIAEKEKLTQEDVDGNGNKALVWKNEDKLFISIMENYYLPEELGIKGATVTRVQGADNDSMNYFKAVYTENGEEKVAYYNYKMDGDSKDNIVIFEKREVEVLGGYEDEQGNGITQEELEAGLENGTYIAIVDGDKVTYYEANDMTPGADFPENSEITATSKTDVTVGEKTERYILDADGNIVKEVTAAVTTVTYTDKTFVSEVDYATEAERDQAAAAKEAELEANGKDATVVKTSETTYVATGTYIPTFKTQIDVDTWHEDFTFQGGKDTREDVFEETVESFAGDDYYVLNADPDLESEKEWGWDGIYGQGYNVTGTVSVTYAEVTRKTVDKDTLGAMWDDIKSLFGFGDSANEKLATAARSVIEAAGGIFLSAEWVDLDWNKATIRYIEGVAVEGTTEKDKAQDAQALTGDEALAHAKKNGATGVMNVKTGEAKGTTTYSYEVNYLEGSSSTENVSVITEIYANAEILTTEVTQNLNYINNVILLTQNDKGYREFVDSAKNLTDKYDQLLKEAQQAQADVFAAQNAVDALQKEIAKLKETGADVAELDELTKKLAAAETELNEAEGKLGTLNEQLDEAADLLDEVVDALTPDTVSGDDDDDDDTTPVVAPAAMPIVVEEAPVDPVAIAAAPGQATIVNIDEEATPLAGDIAADNNADGGDDEVIVAEAQDEEPAIVAIEDEETPLAAGIGADAKMSWWWLLIIALLGATGYKMYQNYQKKKEDAQEA